MPLREYFYVVFSLYLLQFIHSIYCCSCLYCYNYTIYIVIPTNTNFAYLLHARTFLNIQKKCSLILSLVICELKKEKMYLPYYGLNKPPFSISPDPSFLWLSVKHQEAFSALKYGIVEEKGFLSLIGEVGTGKTLLIKNLINEIGIPAIIVTIPDPDMKTLDFFTFLAEEAEMNTEFRAKGEFLIQFKRFLLEAYGSDKKVLLIIDEAQRLSFELLEQIRLLSNIEMTSKKLLNIFFVGQNEFDKMLMDERCRATRQRIAVRYRLEPLDEEETASYIDHRLKVAGANEGIFDSDAIREIYNLSSGFPRNINVICDNALMVGYGLELEHISGEIISEYKQDLHIRGNPESDETQEEELEEPNQAVANQIPHLNHRKEETYRRSPTYFRNLIIFVFLLLFGFAGYFIYDTNAPRHVHWSVQDIAPKKDFNIAETKEEDKKLTEIYGIEKSISSQNANLHAKVTDQGEVEDILVSQLEDKKTVEMDKEKSLTQESTKKSDLNANSEKISKTRSVAPGHYRKDQTEEQGIGAASALKDDIQNAAIEMKSHSSTNRSVIDGRVIIYFNHNSLKLSKQSQETLKLILNILSKYPEASITIKGYTDRQGNYWYNKKLSQSRANVVKNYFTEQGISPYKIQTRGMGSQNPIGSNRTVVGRRQNRRAEIQLKMAAVTN